MSKTRLLQLIKIDLSEWFYQGFWFLAGAFGIATLAGILNFIAETGSWFTNSNGNNSLFFIFSSASIGVFTLLMFIAGIVDGSETGASVRQGISRREHFLSVSTSAIIISIIVIPALFLLHMILSIFDNSAHEFILPQFSGIITQILIYMASYFIGMFISLLWQKIGWVLTLVLLFGTIILSITATFGVTNYVVTTTITEIENVVENEVIHAIETGANNLINSIPTLVPAGIIAIFGTVCYLIVKNLRIKVR